MAMATVVDATAAGGHEESRGRRMARNLVVSFGGQVLTWAAMSVLIVILPTYLGDKDLGKYTFAFGITGLASIVVMFGLQTYLPREIARHPESAAHMAFNVMVSRIPAIILTGLVLAALLYALDYPAVTRQIVYIGTVTMGVVALGSVVNSVLQGLERMTLISVVSVVEKVILMGLALIVLIALDMGVVAFSWITLAAAMISLLLRLAYLWRVVGFSMEFDRRLWLDLYRRGAPFFAWSAALVVYGSIDFTMLSIMTEDEVVGWYGMAYRFIGIPAFLPFAVVTALLPSLSASSGDEFRELARRCVNLVVLTTLPIALFLMVSAEVLIEFFRYPEGFDNSIILLRILAPMGPLAAVGMVLGTVLLASNREGAWAKVAVAAAVLNPVCNLFLIPFFDRTTGNGAIGAAITTLFTEAFMLANAFVLIERGTLGRENLVFAGRCVGAGAVMLVALFITVPFGLIPAIIAGGATYALMALAFGAVKLSDIGEVLRLARSRGVRSGPAPPAQRTLPEAVGAD